MTIVLSGAWRLPQIEDYLAAAAVPLRLACVGDDGFPRVVSLWYRYEAGRFYCVTHRSAKLFGLLQRDARVGFEIATNDPPYLGVRGQGAVELAPLGDDATLQKLLHRYLGGVDSGLGSWLLSRSDQELLISIIPHRLYSWDYRERMADIS